MERQNGTVAVENSVTFPQKAANRIATSPSNSGSRYESRRIESRLLKRYLCTCVPSSMGHDGNPRYPSTDEGMHRRYNGTSFSLKREGHSDTDHNTDEP